MKIVNRKYQPKVSILMTVFDEEKYIFRSLNSLINQSYKKWEAIIVDDFSTDDTKSRDRLSVMIGAKDYSSWVHSNVIK